MAIITHKHAQDMIIDRSIPRIGEALEAQAQLRAAVARTGSLPVTTYDGFYDESGVWKSYLRLDVDSLDSGKGCAP